MIVVRIELHSSRTGHVMELGRMLIGNDSTGTEDVGNYKVMVLPLGAGPTDNRERRTARVTGYMRRTSNIWLLVQRALAAAFP